ncbi:MAG TPA: trypsin-like peptidase domain-containing protein [Oculatellaceae cyanobacterium]
MASKSVVTFVSGAVVGAAMGGMFWAGHEFWPQSSNSQASPVSTAIPPVTAGRGLSQAAASQIMPLAENTIADIAKQASDSVVNIDISKTYTVSDSPYTHFREFGFSFPGFDANQGPHKMERKGMGTGVIYREDGYILTNNHVVGNADKIKVTLNDKREFDGTVVGRDPFTDLAIVKINAKDLIAAKFGTSSNLRPGDWAIAIGSPLGYDHSVTLGIISALGRSLDMPSSNNVQMIQTDAAINPGNSGGPLLNIHGEVVGINVAIRGDGQNISFAIPSDVAKDIASQLLTKGSIQRAYLGIYMQNLEPEIAKSLNIPEGTQGVLVARSAPDGPAAACGLEAGDVIQRVDGQPVTTSKEVQAAVLKHKPKDKMSLLVSRNGVLKPITVEVGERPIKEQS